VIRLAAFLGFIGLAAATAIIVWSGYGQVAQALSVAGFGIVWTSLFHLIPMTCCIIGWRMLIPGKKRPSHLFFLYTLWLRSAVNNLMPVARIGGEFLAVRILMKHGVRQSSAIASTTVELTLSVLGVFVFDVIGISMFAFHVGANSVVLRLALGLLLTVPVLAALVIIQRIGFFGLLDKILALVIRDKWKKFAGGIARLDRAVHTIYRRRVRVLISGFWQFMAWLLGAGEIWLALFYLGHPLPIQQAVMIEALIQASSSAAFAIPGALGVQEAGFVLFGHMLGLAPDIAAALAVIRRCRDVIVYVPGLIAWQIQEGRWLLKKRAV
jgi:putative membrane protein